MSVEIQQKFIATITEQINGLDANSKNKAIVKLQGMIKRDERGIFEDEQITTDSMKAVLKNVDKFYFEFDDGTLWS